MKLVIPIGKTRIYWPYICVLLKIYNPTIRKYSSIKYYYL